MATEAALIYEVSPGIDDNHPVNTLSCTVHFDGFLDHVGFLLLNFYNTREKFLELVSGGYISALGITCTMPYEENSVELSKLGNFAVHTRYYGRDAGEEEQGPSENDHNHNSPYIYRMTLDGVLEVFCEETGHRRVPLTAELIKELA